MARNFIGLDCGGTKTRGVLADETMKILARASGGPGNPLSAGIATASRSYQSVIRKLLRRSGLEAKGISAVGIGAAGAGRRAERLRIVRLIKKLLPLARVIVETDGMIALLGGTCGDAGIIIISGTGSFVLGLDRKGRSARGGGWGPLLGDEGSGASMGREAIQAVLRAEDGRNRHTALRKQVLYHFKVRTTAQLVTRIYGKPPSSREYARLWPVLSKASDKGDSVARAILRKGGEELALTAEAVIKRLDYKGRAIPLILTGGVLSQASLLRRTLLHRLKKSISQIRVVAAAEPPEIGALRLALRACKIR